MVAATSSFFNARKASYPLHAKPSFQVGMSSPCPCKKERFRAPFRVFLLDSLEEISVPVYPVPCVCVTVVAGVCRVCRINAVICSRLRHMSERPCQICSDIYCRSRINIRICPPCITDTHTYAAVRLTCSEQVVDCRIQVRGVRSTAGD